MWKISYFFILIIGFDNCWTIEPIKLRTTEPIRINTNSNNQKYQLDVDEADYEDDYNTPEESEEFQGGRLIGRWRNNGEAIEPKWRDGDSIPLVPFEEAATRRKVTTAKPKENSLNNGRDTITHVFSTNKYREISDENDKKKSVNIPISDIKSMPEFIAPLKEIQNYGRDEFHESLHYNDYANIHRNGSRRYRTRKQKPMDLPSTEKIYPVMSYEHNPVQQTTLLDNYQKILENTDSINVNFNTNKNNQNPLQIHVTDYELNDAEYNRPRSRKRRPPQNYEYVETRTPYPSLDYWQKSSQSSIIDKANDSKIHHLSNDDKKYSENSELKSLLKMQQIEGLSLSEILQRRNLTLSDLLKGKIEIINALKSNDGHDRINHEMSIVKNVQAHPIIKQHTSERPKGTGRRVRIKELRRHPVQTRTTIVTRTRATTTTTSTAIPPPPPPPPTTTTTKISTTINRNIIKEIPHNTNHRNNETVKLFTVNNEGKSRNNGNISTIINQTNPIIFSRFNSTRIRPNIITTSTIKSTINNPIIQYDNEKHLTTTQSIDDEEIMEFSDYAEKKHHEDSPVVTSILSINTTSTVTPTTTIVNSELTTNSNIESTLTTKFNNNIDRDLESTLSIEHILFTDSTTLPTFTTAIIKRDDDNKSNTLIEYNGTENNGNSYNTDEMEYQNDELKNNEGKYIEELMGQMSVNFPESTKIRKIDYTTTVGDSDEYILPSNHRPLPSKHKIYDQVVSEIEPEARAEIFELISTGASAKRLEQLLKSRNMSIDELISLRQRGSSRVHLADISRLRSRSRKNKTRGDQTYDTSQITKINRNKLFTTTTITTIVPTVTTITVPQNLNDLSIFSTLDDISEEIDKMNETDKRFIVVDKTPIVIKISSRTDKDEKNNHATSEKDPGELVDILSGFDSLPFAIYNNYPATPIIESTTSIKNKDIQESSTIGYINDNQYSTNGSLVTTEGLEVGLVEEVEQKTELIDGELLTTTEKIYTFVPIFNNDRKTLSKVRPSIIASGAILGMTIVGFLAIFIVCRIRQKQKYMYKNTFSKAVFQAPVMNARKLSNSSSLNTIMVNVVATSTAKRTMKHDIQEVDGNIDGKSDIDNDSLDANDSWDTIPDFMK